jgi:hypothetical protein
MRALAMALLIGGIAMTSVSTAASGTTLRITYWVDSAAPTNSWTWTVRCNPAGGTLRRPVRACARLASGGAKLFAPLPQNAVCTEIYGGPQKARVVGTVSGRRVHATFTRTNGCEISRWQRISPWLLPAGGVS